MITFIILFFKNANFSEFEDNGYKYWKMENFEIIKYDSFFEIFSNSNGYIKQIAYNVENPFVKIDYINSCFSNKFRVSMLKSTEYSKKSSNKLTIEIKSDGIYDSIIFTISFYNSNENCKIKILKIESNFLKNVDFSERNYKLKYWNVDKNRIWQGFEFKPGIVYKLNISAEGNYRFYVDCLDYKEKILKLSGNAEIIDTINSYCFKQFFVFINDSARFKEIRGKILDTLDFVISAKNKKIYLYKNVDYNEKVLIYDKNGRLIRKELFNENPKVFEFERKGKYLIVIPKKFKKEIKL